VRSVLLGLTASKWKTKNDKWKMTNKAVNDLWSGYHAFSRTLSYQP
jgi:hypothetical protein